MQTFMNKKSATEPLKFFTPKKPTASPEQKQLQKIHEKMTEESKQGQGQGQDQGNQVVQVQGRERMICCCGAAGCGIGPMVSDRGR